MKNKNNLVYTHFKGDNITRCEIIERKVVELIQKSELPDVERAWSKTFELKHSSSVIQFGRILAQKRNLNPELAAIICVMHDIYVFTTGTAVDHAHQGAPIAKQILEETKKFTAEEIEIITSAIYNHSDKHIKSKDPYVELVKDADAFDCSLYDGVHDAYIHEKSPDKCIDYFARIKAVRKELNLPKDPQWDNLDYMGRDKNYHAH
jgi:uncharacterized protein